MFRATSSKWSEFICWANQHLKMRTSWISQKMCLPCLIIIRSCHRINKPRSVICVLCGSVHLILSSTHAKDHGLFILITHKSKRSENPITWCDERVITKRDWFNEQCTLLIHQTVRKNHRTSANGQETLNDASNFSFGYVNRGQIFFSFKLDKRTFLLSADLLSF